MFLVEFFTAEDDCYEVVFVLKPSDREIQDYINDHDWLSVEYATTGLEWNITPIEFVDNTPEEKEDSE